MTGITNLQELLTHMQATLMEGDFVFCTLKQAKNSQQLTPLATFIEQEGTTMVLPASQAQQHDLHFEGTYKHITFNVHSSLEAVGLTAAVASKLAEHNISANVIAAYYHDHIFVPSKDANAAISALKELSS